MAKLTLTVFLFVRLKRPPNEDEFANPLDEMPVMDILEAEKEYNNNQQVWSAQSNSVFKPF